MEISLKTYVKVINIIEADFDAKALCLEFARQFPTEFVAAYEQIEFESSEALSPAFQAYARELIMMLKGYEKVAAIKHTRHVFGWGLAHAKYFCDAVERGTWEGVDQCIDVPEFKREFLKIQKYKS